MTEYSHFKCHKNESYMGAGMYVKGQSYLVCFTLSLNGSNLTVILLAALRFTALNCFPIADTTPPDLRIVPL